MRGQGKPQPLKIMRFFFLLHLHTRPNVEKKYFLHALPAAVAKSENAFLNLKVLTFEV